MICQLEVVPQKDTQTAVFVLNFFFFWNSLRDCVFICQVYTLMPPC